MTSVNKMTDMTTEPRIDADRAIAEVEEQFNRLFLRVRSTWKRSAGQLHPELQPMGYKVMSTLVTRGPAHAGALAEELHTDKSVLSRQVRVLEGLGLVESRVDERDARARLLAATPVAIERVNAIRRANQAELRGRLAAWDSWEIEKFAELLGRLGD